ncbi:hypothetical protein BM525_19235 (plasmid) [Alteromonas mediterranea]|uniref:Uncharacterized protein n=1 Tax=Alteromonas mediterranea TaxID=314275 RepID=A0AAC9JED7_9ALTE|nr:hypothetical protein [Alteromonas mediterranea]APD92019.1 hypothetical protein BM524_19040 [Alteromonas mediterranea]APD99873.1 hypothetical protein BM525_19235 [Alteromonas mediterranea]
MLDSAIEQDYELSISEMTPKKATPKTPARSVEELHMRYLGFCENHGLDTSISAEDLILDLDFESPQYLYVERYLQQRQAAMAANLLTLKDAPYLPTQIQRDNAAKKLMEEIESVADMSAESIYDLLSREEKGVYAVGSIIASLPILEEKSPRREISNVFSLPCLTAKKTKSGKFQMGFAI